MNIQNDRIIIALDLPCVDDAISVVDRIGPHGGFYKVGLGMLFDPEGGKLLRFLRAREKKLFLDVKLHDIGNTVKLAIRNLIQWNPEFLTVHASPPTVRAATEELNSLNSACALLAVTVLTDHEQKDLIGIKTTLKETVYERAKAAIKAGADGLVCSGEELGTIRELASYVVVPGVRLDSSRKHDQKRTVSPLEAFQKGTSHIVVGREVTEAKDPLERIQAILESVNTGEDA